MTGTTAQAPTQESRWDDIDTGAELIRPASSGGRQVLAERGALAEPVRQPRPAAAPGVGSHTHLPISQYRTGRPVRPPRLPQVPPTIGPAKRQRPAAAFRSKRKLA
jgi:hypothetical protein